MKSRFLNAQSQDTLRSGLIDIETTEKPVMDVSGKNEFWKYNNYEDQVFKCSKSGDFAQRVISLSE